MCSIELNLDFPGIQWKDFCITTINAQELVLNKYPLLFTARYLFKEGTNLPKVRHDTQDSNPGSLN